MLTPIYNPHLNLWMLGKIEKHTAKPLSKEEVEEYIKERAQLSEDRQKMIVCLRGIARATTGDINEIADRCLRSLGQECQSDNAKLEHATALLKRDRKSVV